MESANNEEDRTQLCLKELRKLLEGEISLDCPRDDEFLMRFVRAKKCNAEAAFKNLKMYYRIRLKHPDSFECLFPSRLKHVLDSGAVGVLKYRDDLKRKVFVFRVGHWNSDCFTFEEVTIASLLVAEEISYCQESQKVGAVVIIDHHGLSMGHAKQLTVSGLRKLLQLFQDCFPGRYKAIHLINQPYLFDVFFSVAKKFMSTKIKRRIHFHPEYHTMLKFMPSSILPESLGGSLQEDEAWDYELMLRLYSRDKFYKDLLQYGYKKR